MYIINEEVVIHIFKLIVMKNIFVSFLYLISKVQKQIVFHNKKLDTVSV